MCDKYTLQNYGYFEFIKQLLIIFSCSVNDAENNLDWKSLMLLTPMCDSFDNGDALNKFDANDMVEYEHDSKNDHDCTNYNINQHLINDEKKTKINVFLVPVHNVFAKIVLLSRN